MIGEVALAIAVGRDAVDIGKTIRLHPTLDERNQRVQGSIMLQRGTQRFSAATHAGCGTSLLT